MEIALDQNETASFAMISQALKTKSTYEAQPIRSTITSIQYSLSNIPFYLQNSPYHSISQYQVASLGFPKISRQDLHRALEA